MRKFICIVMGHTYSLFSIDMVEGNVCLYIKVCQRCEKVSVHVDTD